MPYSSPILFVQFNSFWYIHRVVYPSPQTAIEYFHYSPKKSCIHSWPFPISSSSQPLTTTILLSLSLFLFQKNLVSLNINESIHYVIFCATFTQHNIFKVHSVAKCINISLLFVPEYYFFKDNVHFFSSTHQLIKIWVVFLFGY